MGEKTTTSLDTVSFKVNDEGLGYCIEEYFGRDLNTKNEKLNKRWAEAHDALTKVRGVLEELGYELY